MLFLLNFRTRLGVDKRGQSLQWRFFIPMLDKKMVLVAKSDSCRIAAVQVNPGRRRPADINVAAQVSLRPREFD